MLREDLRTALGRGKQVTSITMTVFYLLLWHVGLMSVSLPENRGGTCLMYLLAGVQTLLCVLPQNRWGDSDTPIRWGGYRNIPFVLMGLLAAGLFFRYRNAVPGLSWMWAAILISSACYFPVVLWSGRRPWVGMLMLPKTCAYLWMLAMCLSIVP